MSKIALFSFIKRVLRIIAIPLAVYVLLVVGTYLRQRSLLFFPTHLSPSTQLTPWRPNGQFMGYCREVTNPRAIWLMMHGNAGQAADRDYVLRRMSDQDSLYVLEYPGYGSRAGSPGMGSMNQAASEAYQILRSQNPGKPVCALGESIGSGPACSLAQEKMAPDKIVLVVPFDTLASVASEQFWFLPVRLLLRDRWDNIEALKHYSGPVAVYGAESDSIIGIRHAKNLAAHISNAAFTAISGGHNDWSDNADVRIVP